MIVTRGSALDLRVAQAGQRTALRRRAELIGLCVVTLTALCGWWLTYAAKTVRFAVIEGQLAARQLLLLDSNVDPEHLSRVLMKALGNEEDAHFAAGRIAARLRSSPALTHVGMLHQLAITTEDLAAHPDLAVYGERWRRAQERAREGGRPAPVRLALLEESDIHRIKPSLLARPPETFRHAFRVAVPWFFAPFFGLWLIWALAGFKGDETLLPAIMLLSALGVAAMLSIQDPLRDSLKFADFIHGAAAGCVVLGICSGVRWERLGARRAWPPLAASLALSLLLVILGRGPAGSTDTRIILFGTQPAPLVRMLLVFFLAAYFARRWEFLRSLALNRTSRWRIPRPVDLAPMSGGVGLALLLFLVEKDTGPAVVLFLTWTALYLAARKHVVLIAASVVLLGVGVWAGLRFMPKQLTTAAARLELYRNTWDNRVSTQTAQALWAYAAGGPSGQGLGLGYPVLVPESTTDMVIPAIGEETGAAGVASLALLYGLVVFTGLGIARRAASPYQLFLALGLTVSLAVELMLIAGGSAGVLPLSGVVSPFLSYGRSTQLVDFGMIGVLCAISARRVGASQNAPFSVPMKAVGAALLALAGVISGAVLGNQTVLADTISARLVTIHARNGSLSYVNPRLEAFAAAIRRGSIYDRNGLVLASSDWEEVRAQAARFQAIGIDISQVCEPSDVRHYPGGSLTIHLVGDLRQKLLTQHDNQIERRWNRRLQGWERIEELVPLLRHRFDSGAPQVRDLLQGNRDVRLSLDLALQARVAASLRALAGGKPGAAAVATDALTGEVLAAYSIPAPEVPAPGQAFTAPEEGELMDRSRTGVYTPGSIFKLIVAEIGLMHDPGLIDRHHACVRLPGESRVGALVPGYGRRPVRDDIRDRHPHGDLSLAEALTVSCNAYFAQFGTLDLGAERLMEADALFGVRVAPKSSVARLKSTLPWSSFGQGEVQTGLLPVARALGVVASGGGLAATRWTLDAEPSAGPPRAILQPDSAAAMQQALRDVVTRGTGTRLSDAAVPLAGKSGTAEVRDREGNPLPSNSLFGAYNDTPGRRLVMVAMVEQGGYGGGLAASIVGEMAKAAVELNLLGSGR